MMQLHLSTTCQIIIADSLHRDTVKGKICKITSDRIPIQIRCHRLWPEDMSLTLVHMNKSRLNLPWTNTNVTSKVSTSVQMVRIVDQGRNQNMIHPCHRDKEDHQTSPIKTSIETPQDIQAILTSVVKVLPRRQSRDNTQILGPILAYQEICDP